MCRAPLTTRLKNSIETIKLFCITTWNQDHPVFNSGKEKDEPRKTIHNLLSQMKPKDIVIFSDGSNIPKKRKRLRINNRKGGHHNKQAHTSLKKSNKLQDWIIRPHNGYGGSKTSTD
ncbi:hypothetical protein O181_060207 [Austropuccinia psidii MF-1]|uniref:Uncharacterized protein n=1 Tax=Austropuccinia psidii MF-1 TaxID=1389203 RepID=A0A9Q3EI77_9BASI|nr:hypothetical protein [Austropuccinia psidii MF-1]